MAGKTPAMKLAGLALLVIGIGLAYWGYDQSGSYGAQITEAVTGSQTDKVMQFYVAGAVCFVLGLFMFIKK